MPLHCPIIIPKNIVGSWKFLDTPRLPHTHIYTHIHTHIHTHITRTHSQSNDNKSWNKVILFCVGISVFLALNFYPFYFRSIFMLMIFDACLFLFLLYFSLFLSVSVCKCFYILCLSLLSTCLSPYVIPSFLTCVHFEIESNKFLDLNVTSACVNEDLKKTFLHQMEDKFNLDHNNSFCEFYQLQF